MRLSSAAVLLTICCARLLAKLGGAAEALGCWPWLRYSRAWVSQRCTSSGTPPVISVMWIVAVLSHFWHFIEVDPTRARPAATPRANAAKKSGNSDAVSAYYDSRHRPWRF